MPQAIEHTPQELILPVLGMTCSACQAHVEQALQKTPGVREASVNLMSNRARILYDASVTTPSALVEAIRKSGYDAVLPRSTDAPAQKPEAAPIVQAVVAITAAALAMLFSMPIEPMHSRFDHSLMQALPWLYSLPASQLKLALLFVTLAVTLWAGSSIFRRAWSALIHGATNMNTLVSLGMISAMTASIAAIAAPEWFLAHNLEPHIYFESVLFILGFLLLGQVLDARARTRSIRALQDVAALQPSTAQRLRNNVEERIPITDIEIGDALLVRPGERIPADGNILSGSSFLDESLLTGESLPVARNVGERVLAGSLSTDGALTITATHPGHQSQLAQMLRLMEQAQISRAPMQRLADRVSSIFVPAVLVIALLTFLSWGLLLHNWSLAVFHAIAVLVIACPCAMGLAVPAAVTVSLGRAAQLGLLIKGGDALERLASANAIALDKTGTLTLGQPVIISAQAGNGIAENQLLQAAADLEANSQHPLAQAVLNFSAIKGIKPQSTADHRILPGRGAIATQGQEELLAGNAALLAEFAIPEPIAPTPAPGCTRLFIARGASLKWRVLGWLDATDQLRPEAPATIVALRKLGLTITILTGDSDSSARPIASALGITDLHASLLPEQKLAAIRKLQSEGKRVAMVGDGVNDAAALSQSDAGIALGSGTDLAQEAGDAILPGGKIQRIPEAIRLSRAARSIMRENLLWAAGYNVIGIPLAAGIFGLNLGPSAASAAMALSSLSVLANSLRLARWQPR
jgi:Cu+-exporting ATPase